MFQSYTKTTSPMKSRSTIMPDSKVPLLDGNATRWDINAGSLLDLVQKSFGLNKIIKFYLNFQTHIFISQISISSVHEIVVKFCLSKVSLLDPSSCPIFFRDRACALLGCLA